jgi:alkylation response protein AidB-like acyl-CoA dehydrogenase
MPREVHEQLAELGAFGMKIPVEYGGLGLSQRTYTRAIALAGSCSTISSVRSPRISRSGCRSR